MRHLSFALVSAASLAALPACEDTQVVPMSARWLEWSDSAVAGAPFGVRIRGLDAFNKDLRIVVRVAGDTVTIFPYSLVPDCRFHCVRNPGPVPWYDTLVWVPAFTAAAARTVTIRAPSAWQAAGPPWPLRTFGTMTVAVDTPVVPLMHSVGVGSGFKDSFGCFLVFPASLFQTYVSADQAPSWAPGFTGFVYGRIDPVLRSTCLDDAPVIQVDSIK